MSKEDTSEEIIVINLDNKPKENKSNQQFKKSKEQHFDSYNQAKLSFDNLTVEKETQRKRLRRRISGYDVVIYKKIN